MNGSASSPASGWRGRWRAASLRRAPQWPMPNFLPPRRRAPMLAWALCATGVACLAVALVQAWQQQRAVEAADRLRTHWQAEVARLRPSAPATMHAPSATPEPSTRARGEAQRMALLLGHRWDRVLPPLEQPAIAVQWLRLAHDAARGDVLLEGRAPTREDALSLATSLASATGWHTVQLQRVEQPSDGTQAVRFEVIARVSTPVDSTPVEAAR